MMGLEEMGRNIWKKNSVIPLPCGCSSPFRSCLDTRGGGGGGGCGGGPLYTRTQGHNDNTQNPDSKPPSKQFLWLMSYISSTNRSSDLVGETSAQILPSDFIIFVWDLSAPYIHTQQPNSQPTLSFEMIYLVSFIHAHSKPTNSNWKIEVEFEYNTLLLCKSRKPTNSNWKIGVEFEYKTLLFHKFRTPTNSKSRLNLNKKLFYIVNYVSPKIQNGK